MSDAISNTAEIATDIVATASHILAQVLCLIVGFIVYLLVVGLLILSSCIQS